MEKSVYLKLEAHTLVQEESWGTTLDYVVYIRVTKIYEIKLGVQKNQYFLRFRQCLASTDI